MRHSDPFNSISSVRHTSCLLPNVFHPEHYLDSKHLLVAMSTNAKYSAAPQRDSLDTAHYSQAPPSYVDEPSSSTDAALLGGAPRISEDNIPDDFKVGYSGGIVRECF